MSWQPAFGAWIDGDRVCFRVWAPKVKTLDVAHYAAPGQTSYHPLQSQQGGFFTGRLAGLGSRALYKYRLDGAAEFPDPASRFQPEGVHGP